MTSKPFNIPFNKPYLTGDEIKNILLAHRFGHLSGNGHFTQKCQDWLELHLGCKRALLTHSCTAALEMAAILADIQPGDEVIMPSYTFVSTANAFVLRGGVPVFIDVREDTLNIDESLIEDAVSPRTKAIVAVHYGGVGVEIETLKFICDKYDLLLIEDAAQGLMATYKGLPLGSFGDLGAVSFHETKNIISGEGGALLVNNPKLIERAEVIWEKGTNRNKFFRGEVDKYTWVDIGSSYLPGEIVAAFLYAQLTNAHAITNQRLKIWGAYHKALEEYEINGFLRRPVVPSHCYHNAHLYYILLKNQQSRNTFISRLKALGIHSVFHYIPLHSSPAGKKYGCTRSQMTITDDVASRLLRLPLWVELDVEPVLECLSIILNG